ncbi:MAG: PQQ-dependent sugar dehydrogenase [Rubrobacteridae bacterium]|nr:PQQ-dependent sugar dehydrogenase [Rubrobacteridae bacterium]
MQSHVDHAEVNVPKLTGYHETGLLGIALHPNFKSQPYIYIYRTCSKNGKFINRVIRIRDDNGKASDAEIIIDNIPGGQIHNGGIILFGPDGNLYVATGETGLRNQAQNQQSLAGKILRVSPRGGIPPDNPFRDSAVYSYGHRNIFGMAFRPETGELFVTENGPESDDEINKILPGANYGWPEALGRSNNKRYTNPIRTYASIIAPTQAVFYSGNLIKNYDGWLIFGTYIGRNVRAIQLTGKRDTRIAQDKVIFQSDEPIAGISQSPDGGLYVIKETSIQKLTVLP